MFSDETAVFSCDNMNKVKVGASAVSRYNQLTRYFQVGDSLNLPDHDFSFPGYLLIPSGYMLLGSKERDNSTATDVQTSSPLSSINPGASQTLSTEIESTTDFDEIVLGNFCEYDLGEAQRHRSFRN